MKIAGWVKANLLNLNYAKCKAMIISRKGTTLPTLFLDGDEIEEVKSYRYLGLHITSDLKWDTHVAAICQKSRKLLGMLYRKFYTSLDPTALCRLYVSLVRPILEYACQVWDPYTQKCINEVESVQKFALKISSHCWRTNYDNLLDIFHLPSLAERREYLRLITLHKILLGKFTFPPNILLPKQITHDTRNARSNNNAYSIPFARTLSFKSSFVPRTVAVWNNLGEEYKSCDIVNFQLTLKRMML